MLVVVCLLLGFELLVWFIKIWMKYGKYEFLVKNEFDVEFVKKQCYEFVFVSVLIAFLCMLTNNKVV
jgi:hypothetical protein